MQNKLSYLKFSQMVQTIHHSPGKTSVKSIWNEELERKMYDKLKPNSPWKVTHHNKYKFSFLAVWATPAFWTGWSREPKILSEEIFETSVSFTELSHAITQTRHIAWNVTPIIKQEKHHLSSQSIPHVPPSPASSLHQIVTMI